MIIDIEEVERLGPFDFRVSYMCMGTPVRSFLPTFPVGQFVAWKYVSSLTFDASGRISRHKIRIVQDLSRGLEPAIRDGLASCALGLAASDDGCQLLQAAIEAAQTTDHAALVQNF